MNRTKMCGLALTGLLATALITAGPALSPSQATAATGNGAPSGSAVRSFYVCGQFW